MPQDYIGFVEALQRVKDHTPLLAPVETELSHLAGLVTAAEILARVASPSVTASTKDGFAVQSHDLAQARPETPVTLELIGDVVAGGPAGAAVTPGKAARITTGGPLPPGCDAVLAREYAELSGNQVICTATAEPGRNVLAKGSDVDQGQVVAPAGIRLDPNRVGLLAAAGCSSAMVHPLPRVALMATGKEVVAPGKPLPAGGLYASNLVTLAARLSLMGCPHISEVVDDDETQIAQTAASLLDQADILLTSGGAWTSRRDLVVSTLTDMGMELIFRRVRLGPGKGVAFGLLHGKPVFCLPGGPPSNEMAFLQLALPCLHIMAGRPNPGLPTTKATLTETLSGTPGWTQAFHGLLQPGNPLPSFIPLPPGGRLKAMADAQAITILPESQATAERGSTVEVQIL